MLLGRNLSLDIGLGVRDGGNGRGGRRGDRARIVAECILAATVEPRSLRAALNTAGGRGAPSAHGV